MEKIQNYQSENLFKKNFDDAKKSLKKANDLGSKSLTELNKFLKSPKQKSNLILKSEACNVTLAGYAELSAKAGSVETITLDVIVKADLSYTYKHQFVAWVIPIALEVKIGAKGELEGIISYNIKRR